MSTEAVISDGGATAPAEAIIDPADADRAPSPISTQLHDQQQPTDKPAATIDDAIDRAMAKQQAKAEPVQKAEAKPAEKPAEPKQEAKPQPARGEHGHFAAKDQPATEAKPQEAQQQTQKWEAPQRFSPEGKQHWETAPEPVKAEVHRALRELETGLQEHQKRWEPLKQYDDLARQNNTTLHEGLERYVAFDRHLSQDLFGGLEGVIRDKTGGQYGLRDIAAQVMGQQPDQQRSQADTASYQSEQRIASLEQNIRTLAGHLLQQTRNATSDEVVAFSKGKDDFEVLAPQIVEHIRNGKSLPDAYAQARTDAEDMARKLGFVAPSSSPAKPLNPAPAEPEPLNPAGQKSVSGSPSSTITPPRKKGPLPSIDETLSRIGL